MLIRSILILAFPEISLFDIVISMLAFYFAYLKKL